MSYSFSVLCPTSPSIACPEARWGHCCAMASNYQQNQMFLSCFREQELERKRKASQQQPSEEGASLFGEAMEGVDDGVGCGAVALVHGGANLDGQPLGDLWLHKPETAEWEEIRDIVSSSHHMAPRREHSLVLFEDMTAVVFGGATNNNVLLNDVWKIDLCAAAPKFVPMRSPKGSEPRRRCGHSACAITPWSLIVIGGLCSVGELGDCFMFNRLTAVWRELKTAKLPSPLSNAACCSTQVSNSGGDGNGSSCKVYLFGGRTAKAGLSSKLLELDATEAMKVATTASKKENDSKNKVASRVEDVPGGWREVFPLSADAIPVPRSHHTLALVNSGSTLVVTGGRRKPLHVGFPSELQDSFTFSLESKKWVYVSPDEWELPCRSSGHTVAVFETLAGKEALLFVGGMKSAKTSLTDSLDTVVVTLRHKNAKCGCELSSDPPERDLYDRRSPQQLRPALFSGSNFQIEISRETFHFGGFDSSVASAALQQDILPGKQGSPIKPSPQKVQDGIDASSLNFFTPGKITERGSLYRERKLARKLLLPWLFAVRERLRKKRRDKELESTTDARYANIPEEMKCYSCHRLPIEIILHPCGHFVVCAECSVGAISCPMCGAFILGREIGFTVDVPALHALLRQQLNVEEVKAHSTEMGGIKQVTADESSVVVEASDPGPKFVILASKKPASAPWNPPKLQPNTSTDKTYGRRSLLVKKANMM